LKETIFTHLGDEYSWELPGGAEIHLPVIVRDYSGKWHCFSSARLGEGGGYEGFYLAHEGGHAHKVVGRDASGNEYRPVDFSITKNVVAIGIGALFTMWVAFALARYYRRKRFKAPRKGVGFIELLVEMVYKEVIVEVLEKDARRFGPYLLTLFFFILVSNLLGMIVLFPGGANVTGNISVTLVLAFCTFVVVNLSGTKKYWHETFWPEVPLWLKFPIPLMPVIEVFSVITKPIALMIRLFANMLGGHLIALVLVSLIFLLGVLGDAVMGGTVVISVVFSLFMNVLHLLIAFIQAYVFMMLSTIFIRLARE
jgi:F-type H+-transporting ATPase subunit a